MKQQKKEPRFTNARKRDLGDFVMRELTQRDATLTANQIRKVCSHLYTRLRTKAGSQELARQKYLAGSQPELPFGKEEK